MYAGANLRAGVGVVINLVSRSLLQHMNVTAIDFAPGIDELQAAGLAVAASRQVAPPRIADSPVSMECRVRQVLDVATPRHIVVADVLALHVSATAVLDPERLYIHTPRPDLVAPTHGGGRTEERRVRDRG